MKKVNSLSGGKTSSYMAVHYPADYEVFALVCIDDKNCAPKDKAVKNYANKKLEVVFEQYGEFIATAEDDKTLVAMMDLEQFIGREIIWVRGVSFDRLLQNRAHLPSWSKRYCTIEMKILPIFHWWFKNIGQRIDMRIGFRANEFDRMLNFLNNSNPNTFSIPVSCNTYGKKRQKHQEFNWRYCSFPLVKDGISLNMINEFWQTKGYTKATLFNESKKIEFPALSNCIGCFHKDKENLAVSACLNPEKFKWFSSQEEILNNSWLDDKTRYSYLFDNRYEIAKERLYEVNNFNSACDSEGCTN